MIDYKQSDVEVTTIWATPNGDQLLADMARVSVLDNEGKSPAKLIRYMADHGHWSPFDMVSLSVEVWTPRDISRQILRHYSIKPQEFSQRYAEVDDSMFITRQLRTQHPSNRQMSTDIEDEDLSAWWLESQTHLVRTAVTLYKQAIRKGVAKEVARVLLPEGMTMSRLYLTGSVRSWVHYINQRTNIDAVQREHVWVAEAIKRELKVNYPITYSAFFD